MLWVGVWVSVAQNTEEIKPGECDPPAKEYTFPWIMGEKLEYKIYWGVFPVADTVGTATWAEWKGKKYVKLQFRTRSGPKLRKLYPVDDTIFSLVDPETMLPEYFMMDMNEGRHDKQEQTFFDHGAGTATMVKLHKEDKPSVTYKIDPDSRDIISLMFFMRSKTFEANTDYETRVMSDEKLYDLKMHAKNFEEITLKKYGSVKALKVEPEAAFDGVFVRKGKMTLWFSDGSRKLCLKMVADTPFANIKMMLIKVSGPGNDEWVQRKQSGEDDFEGDEKDRPMRR
jgi:hypothetical protein